VHLTKLTYFICPFLFRKEKNEKKSALTPERWRYAFALRQATLLLVWCEGKAFYLHNFRKAKINKQIPVIHFLEPLRWQ